MGLAVRDERVGLHIPRPDRHSALLHCASEIGAPLRAHVEVVLDHDRLPVEHETKAGVVAQQVEHTIDGVDEPAPETLECAIPLAIPVRVRHEHAPQVLPLHAASLALPTTIGPHAARTIPRR